MEQKIQKGLQALYGSDYAPDPRDGQGAEEQDDGPPLPGVLEQQAERAEVLRIIKKHFGGSPFLLDFADSLSMKARKGLAMILEKSAEEENRSKHPGLVDLLNSNRNTRRR